MSGDEITDGRGTSGEPDEWYTARDGRRAGPFRFGVLVELARARVLRADDLVWSENTAIWVHAFDIPGLFRPLGWRHGAVETIPDDHPKNSSKDRDHRRPRTSSLRGRGKSAAQRTTVTAPSSYLLGGAAWVIGAWVLMAFIYLDVLDIRDLLVEKRIQVFGTVATAALAFYVMPRVWQASEAGYRGICRLAARTLRLLAGMTVLVFVVASVPLLVQLESSLLVAFGLRPMGSFEVTRLEDGTGVALNGSLGAGVTSEVASVLDSMPGARTIHLNSSGGWIKEGRYMRDLIREKRLATRTSTQCASACVVAFIAGRRRSVDVEAKLGFHAFSGRGVDPLHVKVVEDAWSAELRAMGVSEAFIQRARSTPATDMWYPTHRELIENHLIDGELADH